MEGMATGIPVVASDHAGLPELVIDEKTGLQVPSRNSEALKYAVIRLYKNADIVKKISLGGRLMVEKEHDLNSQVKKTEDLYRQLI